VVLNFLLGEHDQCYASCVFTKNKHKLSSLPFEETIVGGTGSGCLLVIPDEIEHMMPDYSLYNCNYSMGFTSRGCIRNCPWCIVPQKEGGIKAWASIYEFWWRQHGKIVLLDNNLLAAPNWKQTLKELARERVKVDFNQGLDIRLINEENACALAEVNFGRGLRFSFDEPSMEPQVRKGIGILKEAGIDSSRISFYVLIAFDTSYREDMERLDLLRSYRCDHFLMRYKEVNGVKARVSWDGPGTLRDFLFWANRKPIYASCTYREYLSYGRGERHAKDN